MEILSRDYGTIEIDESSIIEFDAGIIGFEEFRHFALLDDGKNQSPFRCLQSIEDCDLAFILLDPFCVKPDYEFTIDEEIAGLLTFDGNGEILIYAIVVIPEDVKMMSLNLKAPVIINPETKKGMQHIVDKADYNVRHYVFDEIERAKKMGLYKGQTAV